MKLSHILEAKHIGHSRRSRFYTPEDTDNVRCSNCSATYTLHKNYRKDYSRCPACQERNNHKTLSLSEAKHMSFSAKNLAEQLKQIVYDSFYDLYIDDYENHEDYLDAAITQTMKNIEKASPPEHKERLANVVWSAYSSFDESEYVDTESLVDAVINDIVGDLHQTIHFRLGLSESKRSLLKKELQKVKKRKTRKDLAKMEDPLDKDHMAGHTDNGPSFS